MTSNAPEPAHDTDLAIHPALRWRWADWAALDGTTVHDLLKLRAEVFVVEQACAYLDIDGLDPHCLHLLGRDAQGRLQACLRLLPPGLKTPLPAIGRLVVAAPLRKTGVARHAMQAAIQACAQRYPGQAIQLSGQQHLAAFYASLGFRTVSAPYLEDGIPHVDMQRPPGP